MARRLPTRLPRNFAAIVEAGDLDAMKAVFTARALDARDRSGNTLLHLRAVPEELKIWALGRGLPVDVPGADGDSALHRHVCDFELRPDFLLERGADINAVNDLGETPVHLAVFWPENLEILLRAGADAHRPDHDGETPLLRILRRSDSGSIEELAAACRLLEPSAEFSSEVREEIHEHLIRIGEQFEHIRPHYNEDSVDQAAADLTELYDAFDLPASGRPTALAKHDGTSDITLINGHWSEQFDAAWQELVPAMGRATTCQGEAIRIAGRVHIELAEMAGANWDSDLRNMLPALSALAHEGTPLGSAEQQELDNALAECATGSPSDEALAALVRLTVTWVGHNPKPLPLPTSQFDYRR